MLLLSRRVGQSIRIGRDVSVIVTEIRGNTVRLAFEAPRDLRIMRSEIDDDETTQTSTETPRLN